MGSTRRRSRELGLGCQHVVWVQPAQTRTEHHLQARPRESRDMVPHSQIFTQEHALSRSRRGSELPIQGGGSARPRLQDSCLVFPLEPWRLWTLATVTQGAAFGGFLGLWTSPQSCHPSTEINAPPGWCPAEDRPQLWRTARGRGVREPGCPLPLCVPPGPRLLGLAVWAWRLLLDPVLTRFLSVALPVASRSPAWARAPLTAPLPQLDTTGWCRDTGMGVRVELQGGQTALWAPSAGVCLASFALSGSHFCGCFLDEAFLCFSSASRSQGGGGQGLGGARAFPPVLLRSWRGAVGGAEGARS